MKILDKVCFLFTFLSASFLESAEPRKMVPEAVTQTARNFDTLYGFLLIVSAIACVLVIGGFIYFALKYQRKTDNDKTAYISHNHLLEFLWSFIPFVLFMVIFGWGWWIYSDMRTMPKNALEIHVVGQKWFWEFQYKSGKKTTAEFYVPENTPVKLIMTSRDVLHSFFIPSMRIKQDVVPGMYTTLQFTSEYRGKFQVFCTEFCGDQHSSMLAKLHVLSLEDYEEWLRKNPYKGLGPVEIGKKVFAGKCVACHNASTQKKIGPGLAKLFGTKRVFQKAASVVADENYIRESILNPQAKISKGYPPSMPTFQGQISEEELTGLIEYIKSLK